MKNKKKKRLLPSLCCALALLFAPLTFPACEKDNLPNVTITQVAVIPEYDYGALSAYKDFTNIAKREYIVPGLQEGIVPQGMDVWEEKGLLLISGYFDTSTNTSGSPSSMIVAIDLKTGEMAGKYCLKNVDGTDHSRHVGGLAVTKKNVFLANGSILFRIPLSQIKELGKSGVLNIVEEIKVPTRASFCNYSNGVIWVGDYQDNNKHLTPEWRYMTNNDGKLYKAWTVGYKVKDTESEFSDENWNASAMEYATPDYVLSMTKQIQGFTLIGDQIVLSQSGGNNSQLFVYRNVLKNEQDTSVTLNDKSVPVWFLDSGVSVRNYTILPMSEGLSVYNDKLLVLFETGTKKYKNAQCPTEHVWSVALPQ